MKRALLSAWRTPDGWLVSHRHIADAVNQFPDRFVGVASVGLDDPDAVAELERAVKEYGFKASRRNTASKPRG